MKTFHFLGGLPRSGSTVLAAILNQNPAVYCTHTSPLLDQLISNQNICNVLGIPAEQKTNITRHLIGGMWAHRAEPVVIDKNRGWGKNMPASTILFEKDIKILLVIRDLPSIMASWLRLIQNNPGSHIDSNIVGAGKEVNDETRCMEMWENMVKDCMEALQQVRKDAWDRTHVVLYDVLVNHPEFVMKDIENFLRLPAHDYDFNNIINTTNDDDLAAWGLNGMHTIRPTLNKTSGDARAVLGDLLFERFKELEKEYVG